MRELLTSQGFADFIGLSAGRPLFLFKHSTTCPISARALEAYREFLAQEKDPGHALVKVIENRPVSNEIEAATGVRHESPQALLFLDGKVVWHASHRAITAPALHQAFVDLTRKRP